MPEALIMIRIFKFVKPFAPWLFAVWLILIVIFSSLSSLPDTKLPEVVIGIDIDYFLHSTEYAMLAFLAFLTFAKSSIRILETRVLYVVLFLILFSAADEAHQLLIPARSFNYFDLLANILGIICGVFVALFFNKKASLTP